MFEETVDEASLVDHGSFNHGKHEYKDGQEKTLGSKGEFVLVEINEAGENLIMFCMDNNLTIMSTFF